MRILRNQEQNFSSKSGIFLILQFFLWRFLDGNVFLLFVNNVYCHLRLSFFPSSSLSLTHSINHSLTPTLTHSLPHSLTHSLIHSLTRALAHSLAHSFTHSLARSLPHSLTHSFTHSPLSPPLQEEILCFPVFKAL